MTVLWPTQEFESPEEALEHYGVKGMRWGHRKSEDSGSRPTAAKETPKETAARNQQDKALAPVVNLVTGKPVAAREATKTPQFKSEKGLSDRQKTALLIGAGVTVGVGGFVAYKYMGGQVGVPQSWKVPDGLAKGPLSKSKLGDLGHGNDMFELRDKSFHSLDISRGYAVWTPNDTHPTPFSKNPYAKQMQAELIKSVDEMRAAYPSVRNMNIEVVPMSMVPGMNVMAAQKSGAAVMSIKPGEARVMFNDLMPEGYSALEREHVLKMMPGLKHAGFTGSHEMGHLLAAAKGAMPPAFDLMDRQGAAMEISSAREVPKLVSFMKDGVRYNQFKHVEHKRVMKKHGLTYKELSKLSPYAATQPAEALAELAGNYFTPATRAQMSPELASKAKALFDDLGGVTG